MTRTVNAASATVLRAAATQIDEGTVTRVDATIENLTARLVGAGTLDQTDLGQVLPQDPSDAWQRVTIAVHNALVVLGLRHGAGELRPDNRAAAALRAAADQLDPQ